MQVEIVHWQKTLAIARGRERLQHEQLDDLLES